MATSPDTKLIHIVTTEGGVEPDGIFFQTHCKSCIAQIAGSCTAGRQGTSNVNFITSRGTPNFRTHALTPLGTSNDLVDVDGTMHAQICYQVKPNPTAASPEDNSIITVQTPLNDRNEPSCPGVKSRTTTVYGFFGRPKDSY